MRHTFCATPQPLHFHPHARARAHTRAAREFFCAHTRTRAGHSHLQPIPTYTCRCILYLRKPSRSLLRSCGIGSTRDTAVTVSAESAKTSTCYNMQRAAASNMQHAAYNTQHSSCYMPVVSTRHNATSSMQRRVNHSDSQGLDQCGGREGRRCVRASAHVRVGRGGLCKQVHSGSERDERQRQLQQLHSARQPRPTRRRGTATPTQRTARSAAHA